MKHLFWRYYAIAVMTLLSLSFGCSKGGNTTSMEEEIASEPGGPGDPICVECPTYRDGPFLITGQGSAEVENGTQVTFNVNAQRQPNGEVRGKLLYYISSADIGFEMDINCMSYSGASGNEANVSGIVTQVNGSGDASTYDLFVGQLGLLTLKDNGQGNNGADPDAIGHMYLLSTISGCNGDYTTNWPVTGNIQIIHKYLPVN